MKKNYIDGMVIDGRVALELPPDLHIEVEGPKRISLLRMPVASARHLFEALQNLLRFEPGPHADGVLQRESDTYMRACQFALARVEVLAAECSKQSQELVVLHARCASAEKLAKDEAAVRVEIEAERERWARDVERATQRAEVAESRGELFREQRDALDNQRLGGTIGAQLEREWQEAGQGIDEVLNRWAVPAGEPALARVERLISTLGEWRDWAIRIVGEQPNDKGLRIAIDALVRPELGFMKMYEGQLKKWRAWAEGKLPVAGVPKRAPDVDLEDWLRGHIDDLIVAAFAGRDNEARLHRELRDKMQKLLGRIAALAVFEG